MLRILSSNLAHLGGEETPLTGTAVTIGRGRDCTVVLKDTRVSRVHARIEVSSEGWRVLDQDSSNGVWIDERQVEQAVLSDGIRFRIVDTVFEFVEQEVEQAPAADSDQTLILSRDEFVICIVAAQTGGQVGEEFRISGGEAVLGRAEDCTVTLQDENASRHHARIEAAGPGRYRLVDLGSANGIWMGERKVNSELIEAGARFRVGNTYLECRPPAKKKATDGSTRILSGLGDLMAKVAAQRLEKAGEPRPVSGSRVILLDDPRYAYYVVKGKIEVFTVTVKDGRPLGARNHFLTLNPGSAFFGVDPGDTRDSGFLATGKTGTEVRRVRVEELQELCADADVAAQVARVVDNWVTELSARLARDMFPRPDIHVQLQAGEETQLPKGQRAQSSEGTLWLTVDPETLLFLGMATPRSSRAKVLFPVTAQSWIEPSDAARESLELRPLSTASALSTGGLWEGLNLFHQVLCECEFINKRLAVVDEFQRLGVKAREAEAAREKAYDAIGAVLAGRHTEPAGLGPSSRVEPVMRACHLVGQALGMHIKSPAETGTQRTFEDQVVAIAGASRFRTRRVALRGDWWTRDQGPLLARVEGNGAPVALIPKGTGACQIVDPAAGTREPVTREIADSLAPFAYSFYRPFPAGELSVGGLLRFGAQGLGSDLWTLLAMGILTGMLGAATPYLTGQIIDSAIPQSEHSLLYQLGLGMLLVALTSAAFKVTQSIAVVRVGGKMDYCLQAALWDRLLDLPSAFFRKYGAGDLAQRAAGINAIRGLISRAGVSGILGSLSSLAYVVMMLMYNVKLTVVAMGITSVLVGFTFVGNYLQLRHQRDEMELRGGIASLVLQLIAGVAKVRVTAAENHAFRVWAQRFSAQKRVAFSIGQIQNVVNTFSSSFQVLSSLAIFGGLFYVQSSAGPGEPPPFTTGSFVAFNAAFGSFVMAMQSLSDASLDLLRAVPVYERLKPILTTAPETDENKSHPGRLRGRISVSRLRFRYHEDGPWILQDMSLEIQPGQFVAFVGGSGCGKSTLMRLLLGFEKPGSGAICYDGQDLSALDSRAVRQQLGVVLQESRVLPTDIFRNIVGTTSHTMDEAWEAAEMAGLAEDVRQMPMGMHTVVSEGGGTFSGGQRQRLLIARALVNKPRVIFFDEATSALDNKTQAVVTQSMDRLDATRIVIAHRLSTVVNADCIFFFEGGRIVEEGTYDELMAKEGAFAELARRQIA